jgi:alkanesulfonate monooxygenase SsuD/methylene tetrahydromethanopterin reductase-like flavin-dependent oxidoreductase (luciferase family)
MLAQVGAALSCSAVGSPSTVRDQLLNFLNTYRPDELMLTGMIHDHAARIRSFEIAATVLSELLTQKEPAQRANHP